MDGNGTSLNTCIVLSEIIIHHFRRILQQSVDCFLVKEISYLIFDDGGIIVKEL